MQRLLGIVHMNPEVDATTWDHTDVSSCEQLILRIRFANRVLLLSGDKVWVGWSPHRREIL